MVLSRASLFGMHLRLGVYASGRGPCCRRCGRRAIGDHQEFGTKGKVAVKGTAWRASFGQWWYDRRTRSLLLQIARQPTEKKMVEMLHRILQGGLTRDEARRERREEQSGPQRPQPFIFQFEPENETFKFRIQFKKSHVSRDELIHTLRDILAQLEGSSTKADSTAA